MDQFGDISKQKKSEDGESHANQQHVELDQDSKDFLLESDDDSVEGWKMVADEKVAGRLEVSEEEMCRTFVES